MVDVQLPCLICGGFPKNNGVWNIEIYRMGMPNMIAIGMGELRDLIGDRNCWLIFVAVHPWQNKKLGVDMS